MPQESAGRPGRRTQALVLVVGLAMLLVAHVVSCALHATDDHSRSAAETVSVLRPAAGVGVLPLGSDSVACFADHDSDEHPGHGAECCDPADRPADLRASSSALVLALLLLVLTWGRARDPLLPAAPPGGAGQDHMSRSGGLHLLRLVCVSRT